MVFCLVHVAGRCRFEAVGEYWCYMMTLVFNSKHFFFVKMYIGIMRASGWERVFGDSGDVYWNVRGHLRCGPSSGLPR